MFSQKPKVVPMALKRKISKESYGELSEVLQGEYVEKDDDYILNIEGEEDTGKLKRAKDREVERRKEAEKAKREAEERLAEVEGDDARKRGDIETLEKSWKSKADKIENEYKDKLTKRDEFVKKTLIDNVALDMANGFKNPALMMPHIEKRLGVDLEGDDFKSVVLDAKGNRSALTIDELKKEFVANPNFADMIVVSKASGSGASTKNNPIGGGAPVSEKDFSKMSGPDLRAYIDSKEQGL